MIYLFKYVLALFSGVVNGMFGTGGGIVALPMLKRVVNSEKSAFQTVQMFILPLAVLSIITYGQNVSVKGMWYILFGALLGGTIGAFISKKIKESG